MKNKGDGCCVCRNFRLISVDGVVAEGSLRREIASCELGRVALALVGAVEAGFRARMVVVGVADVGAGA